MSPQNNPSVKTAEANPTLNWIERILIWLAGADPNCLAQCPRWEKVKYEAFGASVLVPVAFGMIGSAYAVSTLTKNLFIIVGFCLVWGFIILTIDRVLLATYRAYAGKAKKITQFFIRITVAVLMGLTVSHPLTLLLFKDTIASEVERSRGKEIAKIRLESDEAKKVIDQRLIIASENLAQLQKKYEDTISGDFVTQSASDTPSAVTTANRKDPRFADIDGQLSELKSEREAVRKDLDYWQNTYDQEVSGARGGSPGVGPKARAIEADQLVWRREEMTRLGAAISQLTQRRAKVSTEIVEQSAAANAEIAAQKRNLEKQKLAMFTNQQGAMVGLVKDQIESASAEIETLRGEAKQLSIDTADRIAGLKTEARADIMTQTIVLHHIFEDPKNGGSFALTVYIVIATLFTLIDTLPLVVKFFSVSGPYDMLQHMEGKKYAPFHDLNVFGDPEVFDQQHAAYRRQMQTRMDLYRDMDEYWVDKVEEPKPKPPAIKTQAQRPAPASNKTNTHVNRNEGFGQFMQQQSPKASSAAPPKRPQSSTTKAKPVQSSQPKPTVKKVQRKPIQNRPNPLTKPQPIAQKNPTKKVVRKQFKQATVQAKAKARPKAIVKTKPKRIKIAPASKAKPVTKKQVVSKATVKHGPRVRTTRPKVAQTVPVGRKVSNSSTEDMLLS